MKNNESELLSLLEEVRHNRLKGRELYHAIHEFGRNHFLQARKDVEGFLTNADPQLCSFALEVLVNHWRLPDWDQMALINIL